MGGRDLTTNSTLLIDNELAEVVDVTPPGFFGMAVGESFDIAFPLCEPNPARRELFRPGYYGTARTWMDPRSCLRIFQRTQPRHLRGDGAYWIQRGRYQALQGISARSLPCFRRVSALRDQCQDGLTFLLAITAWCC